MDEILSISFNYQEYIRPSQEGLRAEMKDLLDSVKNVSKNNSISNTKK